MNKLRRYTLTKRTSGALHYAYARLNSGRKKWRTAAIHYEKAYLGGFLADQSCLKLGLMHFRNSDYLDALPYLQKYFDKNHDDEAGYALAKSYVEAREYKLAEKTARSLLLSNNSGESALALLAVSLIKQQKFLEYRYTLEQLVKLYPTTNRHADLCAAYARLGLINSAYENLERLLSNSTVTLEQKVSATKKTAAGFLQSFYYEYAVNIYLIAKRHQIYSPSIANSLGISYEKSAQPRLALKAYEEASVLFPHQGWWFTYKQACVSYDLGMYKRAAKYLIALYGDTSSISMSKKLPGEIQDIFNGMSRINKHGYKSGAKSVLSATSGWNTTALFVGQNLDTIDSESSVRTGLIGQKFNSMNMSTLVYAEYLLIHGLLRKYTKANFYQLLQVQSQLGIHIAKHRLWRTAASYFLRTSSPNHKDIFTARHYASMVRSLIMSHDTRRAHAWARKAIGIFPNDIRPYKELALVYKHLNNAYESNNVWKIILQRWPERVSISDLIEASSISLSCYNLDEHESRLSLARKKSSENLALFYYHEFYSNYTKITNLATEEQIMGAGEYAKHYSKAELLHKNLEIADKMSGLTYTDEQLYKINQHLSSQRLMLMNEEWNSGHTDEAVSILRENTKYLSKTHLLTSDQVIELIKAERNNDKSLRNSVKQKLSAIPHTTFTYDEWLMLYDTLAFNKLLSLGYIAREKAMHLLVSSPIRGHFVSIHLLRKKFHSLLEDSLFDSAKSVLNTIENYFPQDYSMQDLEKLLSISIGSYDNKNEDENQDEDEIMSLLIRNKSVAIVGPAPGKSHTGREIDTYNTVVRFNYRGKSSLSAQDAAGSRTDISYQNGPNVRMHLYDNIPQYLSDVRLYCIAMVIGKPLAKAVKFGTARIGGSRIHLAHRTMMAVPSALFDILQYNPKKVMLYNTNFYLTTNPYAEGYTSHGKHSSYSSSGLSLYKLHELLRTHDLIAQLCFIRNLVNNNCVYADPECAKVLSLSNADYMSRLELVFEY